MLYISSICKAKMQGWRLQQPTLAKICPGMQIDACFLPRKRLN